MAYCDETLYNESNNCVFLLDLDAKNWIQIGHFHGLRGLLKNWRKMNVWTSNEKEWVSSLLTNNRHQMKNAPKSMKNSQFGSGFLYVIQKLIQIVPLRYSSDMLNKAINFSEGKLELWLMSCILMQLHAFFIALKSAKEILNTVVRRNFHHSYKKSL